MAATENNAYYSPSTNQIVFPAAGLQAPMYSTSFHPAQNFGAVGSMIGHELTHGFNSTGREYDGEGNRANWWSNRSSEQFDERAQCFSSQYSNFAVDSANGSVLGHVNGDQTITENIADNGGLNLAFVAYQTYMRNVSLTGKSKLSTAEGEQLFFIAYGQSWCGKMDDNMMQYILSSDPHSLAKWRVNGAVMNNPDFAGVFKCKAGAKMNPKHKCEMW